MPWVSDAFFLMSREWNPAGTDRQAFGLEALVPLAGDTNSDGRVGPEDLVNVLRMIRSSQAKLQAAE